MGKLIDDMSDREKQELIALALHKAAEIQEKAEAEFRVHCLQALSLEHGMKTERTIQEATRMWWHVFRTRAKAAPKSEADA